jgi:hypothetical protein
MLRCLLLSSLVSSRPFLPSLPFSVLGPGCKAYHFHIPRWICPDPFPLNRYIEFETADSATLAIQSLNGFEIGGMQLRVTKVMLGVPMPAGMSSIDKVNVPSVAASAAIPAAVLSAANAINSSIAQKTGGTLPAPAAALATVAKPKLPAAAEESLEDNTNISSSQRFEIMRKLEQSRNSAQAAAAVAAASNVVLLENAAGAEEVDDELKEDMAEECSKYGKVAKIVITTDDSASSTDPPVKIYVQFSDSEGEDYSDMPSSLFSDSSFVVRRQQSSFVSRWTVVWWKKNQRDHLQQRKIRKGRLLIK